MLWAVCCTLRFYAYMGLWSGWGNSALWVIQQWSGQRTSHDKMKQCDWLIGVLFRPDHCCLVLCNAASHMYVYWWLKTSPEYIQYTVSNKRDIFLHCHLHVWWTGCVCIIYYIWTKRHIGWLNYTVIFVINRFILIHFLPLQPSKCPLFTSEHALLIVIGYQ